mmetsp:Transcript_68544/g.200517  ORF Transcript_68544/g.200517 Transcript_68544/m.200517 type:complete len:224 (-) Transcript_68544:290-961(-)
MVGLLRPHDAIQQLEAQEVGPVGVPVSIVSPQARPKLLELLGHICMARVGDAVIREGPFPDVGVLSVCISGPPQEPVPQPLSAGQLARSKEAEHLDVVPDVVGCPRDVLAEGVCQGPPPQDLVPLEVTGWALLHLLKKRLGDARPDHKADTASGLLALQGVVPQLPRMRLQLRHRHLHSAQGVVVAQEVLIPDENLQLCAGRDLFPVGHCKVPDRVRLAHNDR